jgi:hypothetical protein
MKRLLPAPPVARFLADIGSEFSPSKFRAYIAEIKPLVPPGEYLRLRRACRYLTRMRVTVRGVTRRLIV